MLRKRISIRIEQTEVTLSIPEVSTQGPDPKGAASKKPPPRQCPHCGSPWLPNFRDVLSTLRLTPAQLKLAANEGKLHLLCSSDNEVWVCERSIQKMRDECSPSKLQQ